MSNDDHTAQGATLPSAELKSSKFDSGIALALHTWPALTIAVKSHWGGPNSAEKRDWFAGAVSELFTDPATSANVDSEYLAEFLVNVMFDEFEVNVDDESDFDVAEQICKLRKQCEEGDFSGVDALEVKWRDRQGKDLFGKIVAKDVVEEADDDDSVDEESDDAMEVDSSQSRPNRERPPPEVDDDGFTTVRRR